MALHSYRVLQSQSVSSASKVPVCTVKWKLAVGAVRGFATDILFTLIRFSDWNFYKSNENNMLKHSLNFFLCRQAPPDEGPDSCKPGTLSLDGQNYAQQQHLGSHCLHSVLEWSWRRKTEPHFPDLISAIYTLASYFRP